jgi:hypothetical protein
MFQPQKIAECSSNFFGLFWAPGGGTNSAGMFHLLVTPSPQGNPIIQILSAFNCRFFWPNTR